MAEQQQEHEEKTEKSASPNQLESSATRDATGAEQPETVAEGLARRKRTLGRNVERLMDARRMTYNDMAKAARMSRTGVFKIVDGTSNASMESLFAIVDFFGLTLNDLFAAPSPHSSEAAHE